VCSPPSATAWACEKSVRASGGRQPATMGQESSAFCLLVSSVLLWFGPLPRGSCSKCSPICRLGCNPLVWMVPQSLAHVPVRALLFYLQILPYLAFRNSFLTRKDLMWASKSDISWSGKVKSFAVPDCCRHFMLGNARYVSVIDTSPVYWFLYLLNL